MSKLWAGRFQKDTDKLVESFTASINLDYQLIYYDLLGSIAHTKMLKQQKIISQKEADDIIKGLHEIWQEAEQQKLDCRISDEDIHMCVERRLTEIVGESGKKLHSGRSRNDQIALDMQLFIRDESYFLCREILNFMESVTHLARDHVETYMPGYTHMQRAQPTTLGHHLMNYAWKMKRNLERVMDLSDRTELMPLGSGAFAGTSINISREIVADELEFDGFYENSMDGVSGRDVAWEFMFCLTSIMLDLSRLCEDLIIWSTKEFDFITIDDAYATGSSIMPQKKNPDVPELIRGKTGKTLGNLTALATVLKALPMSYNKDMQEDKEGLFDSLHTAKTSLVLARKMLETMEVNKNKMEKALYEDFSNAADLAEAMVVQGIPFRDAHLLVGRIVEDCEKKGKLLSDVSEAELNEIIYLEETCSVNFNKLINALDPINCVKNKTSRGGPAPSAVQEQVAMMDRTITVMHQETDQMTCLLKKD